jgi:hypothetical protein
MISWLVLMLSRNLRVMDFSLCKELLFRALMESAILCHFSYLERFL